MRGDSGDMYDKLKRAADRAVTLARGLGWGTRLELPIHVCLGSMSMEIYGGYSVAVKSLSTPVMLDQVLA
jgi:hypothetical protein